MISPKSRTCSGTGFVRSAAPQSFISDPCRPSLSRTASVLSMRRDCETGRNAAIEHHKEIGNAMTRKAFEPIAAGLTEAVAIAKGGRPIPPPVGSLHRPISTRSRSVAAPGSPARCRGAVNSGGRPRQRTGVPGEDTMSIHDARKRHRVPGPTTSRVIPAAMVGPAFTCEVVEPPPASPMLAE